MRGRGAREGKDRKGAFYFFLQDLDMTPILNLPSQSRISVWQMLLHSCKCSLTRVKSRTMVCAKQHLNRYPPLFSMLFSFITPFSPLNLLSSFYLLCGQVFIKFAKAQKQLEDE